MSASDWIRQLEIVTSTIDGLQSSLQTSASSTRLKSSFQRQVNDCKRDVDTLATSLTNQKSQLSDVEFNRRQQLLQRTRNKALVCEDLLNNPNQLSARRVNYEETTESRAKSNQELMTSTTTRMVVQETKLDEILIGVTSLKHLSTDIGQELDLQQRLLDDMHEGVDVRRAPLHTCLR